MSGKSIAGVLADTLADGGWRAKARPEQLPPKPRPAIRSQPFQSPGDLALVLGDDSEAPAQIGQPAIIKGADLAGSNVEGGAPFDGEAFEARGSRIFQAKRTKPISRPHWARILSASRLTRSNSSAASRRASSALSRSSARRPNFERPEAQGRTSKHLDQNSWGFRRRGDFCNDTVAKALLSGYQRIRTPRNGPGP